MPATSTISAISLSVELAFTFQNGELHYQLGCAACRTPQLVLVRSLMFSHFLVSKLCCGNITLHAVDLIPSCANIAFSQVNPSCLSPVPFSYSVIRNLFQAAQNIAFSQVSATFVLPVPIFLFPGSQLAFQTAKKKFSQVNVACVSRPIFPIP